MSSVAELGLPASVVSRIEMHPVEDLVLAILREKFPDLPVWSLLRENVGNVPAFVLIRRYPAVGAWRGHPKFMDHAGLAVSVVAREPDADEKAALVSEAIRVALLEAAYEQKVYPGIGWLSRIEMDEEPLRKTDWTTATGPVQYAELPAGMFRYEAHYTLWIRH